MEKLNIRKAVLSDLVQILPIYEYARTFMRKNGNETQWGDYYPAEALIRQDIEKKCLYVIEDSNAPDCIHGVFAFIIGDDPSYAAIENGTWLSDKEYGTIHRIAGDGKIHGIFNEAISFCAQKTNHLRIDTHEQNKLMRHLIKKNGFQKCGIIHVADGTPRIAYERISIDFPR